MRIDYNISAMIANSHLKTNDKALSNSLERLSSGLKINHAKDNASGLAMAKRMNAQIRSLETANQNSSDGVSVIEIAEGALTEVEEMIQRMNELAVKSSTGTIQDDDRKMIDDEIKQLKSEIERIADTTMYNGEVLLNGNFDVKGYSDNLSIKVATYSDDVRSGDYSIKRLVATLDEKGNIIPEEIPNLKEDGTLIDNTLPPEAMVKIPGTTFDIEFGEGFEPANAYEYTLKRDGIFVTGPNGFEMEFQVVENINIDAAVTATDEINFDITGLGSMGLQIGTNEGQELDVRIAKIDLRSLGLSKIDCLTQENSLEFLDQMTETLQYINEARSRLGAYQNRLEHTISTLDISEENMTGAYSRIMDVDMAEEMTEYTKDQVLVQASTSMLAQANERPSSVLQLLQ
ncbi:MAG: flagellin FliC3 [Lachnospiraceae bacterium]|nr:flagellin FliC3 [Lachnospiraceae bacterium]